MNDEKYTIASFNVDYLKIFNEVPTYRLGQHFIDQFIKDSTSKEMCLLWEEKDTTKAYEKIYEIINRYDWDFFDLPVITRE